MTIHTCTKVNIGLNVLRKRPDGYHDLETLFVPYWGLGDILTVETAPELSVEILRDGGVDWDPMEDLTVRAWRLLKADFPSLPSVSIRLEKHAPVGAGLGGGSADAAFMLRSLNELGGLGLDDSTLAAYAAKLGSDCAFFVYCHPMFATGRGEILEPFDIDLSAYDLWVELPLDATTGFPVAVSTREAYAGIVPRLLRVSETYARASLSVSAHENGIILPNTCCETDVSALPSVSAQESGLIPLREALRRPVAEWRDTIVNDFEATVCPRHPEIPALIEDFYRRGAVYAAMSGSGSAVFGLFPRR